MIKNNYIHTTTPNVSVLNKPYQKPIYDHAQTCLISLIHVLGSKNFDISKIDKSHLNPMIDDGFLSELREYKQTYLQNSSPLILDSGGYSIIVGDIPYIEINRFIHCYIHALARLKNIYDYVFSLDIPIFLNEPSQNTVANIYNSNKSSLSKSIDIIKNDEVIKEKFSMVLQWKTHKQYAIWDRLYDELELKNHICNYAVGGLVGLLGACPHINFAPFIGACYYWLYRYIEKGDYSRPLFIHILGQYHKSSRFIMFFMQQLFTEYYLSKVNQTCIITYDTINYSISSMFKSRVGIDIYYFDNNGDLQIEHSHTMKDDLISKIYTTDESIVKFKENCKKVKDASLLNDTSFLIPAYVYSQLNLDKFFKEFINKYNLIELFNDGNFYEDLTDGEKSQRMLNFIIPIIKANKNFTGNFISSVKSSLFRIFFFHMDFIRNPQDKVQLDVQMTKFIDKVKFPFELAGNLEDQNTKPKTT